ncbi:hypothetical protein QE152_g7107 [Popillia japonica]|uniref:RNase H type-1 domain-containing protein n=1 Tax=Popillia japonica TaxID=7064 RepID=A0AAW1MGY0_POPJA
MIAQEYAKPPSPTNLGRTYPVPLPHAPHRLRTAPPRAAPPARGERDFKSPQKRCVQASWHCGIPGNERVDIAAKEDCELTETLEIPFCSQDTFNLLKKAMQNEFKEQFLTGTTGLFHKSLQQDDREKAWYANETNRNFIRTMSRLRSNHGICKSYLMKIKLADSETLSEQCLGYDLIMEFVKAI